MKINNTSYTNKTMKALVWRDRKQIQVEDVPVKSTPPGFVKIAVKACGICGSDLHEYEVGPIFIPNQVPHPISGEMAPVVLGHEFAGEIVEIGEGVKNWQVGDRVTPDACISCGTCEYCKEGDYHLCENLGFNGLAADGGFAEFVNVPAYQLYKLHDNMSFKEGALIEPLAVGIHAVKKSRLGLGDTVVIIGAGTIGLAALEAAKAAGASKVFVVELADARKAFAEKLGADLVIDPTQVDLLETVRAHNQGRLADVSIECVGLDISLKEAIDVIKKGGRVAVAGIYSSPLKSINMNDVVIPEKELIGVIAYRNDFQTAIDLVSKGIINANAFITKEVPLKDIAKEGFETLVEQKDKHIKILAKME